MTIVACLYCVLNFVNGFIVAYIYYPFHFFACFIYYRFEDAIEEASTVLLFDPSNVKALFRRAQALEGLEKYDLAFKDARQALHIEPKNACVLPMLERLNARLQDIAKEHSSTKSRVGRLSIIISY